VRLTPVKGRRGRHVHITQNLRMALCGIKVDGFIVTPDEPTTCPRCVTIAMEFDREAGFN